MPTSGGAEIAASALARAAMATKQWSFMMSFNAENQRTPQALRWIDQLGKLALLGSQHLAVA